MAFARVSTQHLPDSSALSLSKFDEIWMPELAASLLPSAQLGLVRPGALCHLMGAGPHDGRELGRQCVYGGRAVGIE